MFDKHPMRVLYILYGILAVGLVVYLITGFDWAIPLSAVPGCVFCFHMLMRFGREQLEMYGLL